MTTDQVLLKPGEVAAMFGVSAKTVNRWARAGQVPYVRTMGGHFRFYANEVEAALERNTVARPPSGAAGAQGQVGLS